MHSGQLSEGARSRGAQELAQIFEVSKHPPPKALETPSTGRKLYAGGRDALIGLCRLGNISTSRTRDEPFPLPGQETPGGAPSEEYPACAEQPRMVERHELAAVSAAHNSPCDLRHRQPLRAASATRSGNTTSSWEVQQRL